MPSTSEILQNAFSGFNRVFTGGIKQKKKKSSKLGGTKSSSSKSSSKSSMGSLGSRGSRGSRRSMSVETGSQDELANLFHAMETSKRANDRYNNTLYENNLVNMMNKFHVSKEGKQNYQALFKTRKSTRAKKPVNHYTPGVSNAGVKKPKKSTKRQRRPKRSERSERSDGMEGLDDLI
jgi:hypothetical protein